MDYKATQLRQLDDNVRCILYADGLLDFEAREQIIKGRLLQMRCAFVVSFSHITLINFGLLQQQQSMKQEQYSLWIALFVVCNVLMKNRCMRFPCRSIGRATDFETWAHRLDLRRVQDLPYWLVYNLIIFWSATSISERLHLNQGRMKPLLFLALACVNQTKWLEQP